MLERIRDMDFNDCNCISDIALKQELLQMTSVTSESDTIFHYTSSSAIQCILKKEEISLRFTRIDLVNDTTEMKSIMKYYSKLCETLLRDNEIDKNFYNHIRGLLPSRKRVYFRDLNPIDFIDGQRVKTLCVSEYVSYVFCFSKLSDSLPMWNYYLKDGIYSGFNLGFSTEGLKSLFHYHSANFSDYSELIVVEYDQGEKDDIMKDFILALYEHRESDDAELSDIKSLISKELSKWQCGFKQSCFSHEEEIRLIIHLPVNESRTKLRDIDCRSISYDKCDNIPKYIFTSLLNKKLLKSIKVSPVFNGYDEILSKIESMGYIPKISNSDIPIRF